VASRNVVIAGFAVALAIGSAIAIERLIVTEEERLEGFVDDVTGKIESEKIDKALQWTDAERQPIELSVRGATFRFEQQAELSRDAHRKLAPFDGERLSLLSSRIEVKDKTAAVTVDTFSRRGRNTVVYDLRKIGDRWLVSAVDVR